MQEAAALILLIFLFSFSMLLLSKRRKKPAPNVLQFRKYHRIEWLRKRRAAKAAKLKGTIK